MAKPRGTRGDTREVSRCRAFEHGDSRVLDARAEGMRKRVDALIDVNLRAVARGTLGSSEKRVPRVPRNASPSEGEGKPFRSREISSPRHEPSLPLRGEKAASRFRDRNGPRIRFSSSALKRAARDDGIASRETEAEGTLLGRKGPGRRMSRGMPDQWRRPLTTSARCIRLHPAPHECVDRKKTQHIHAQDSSIARTYNNRGSPYRSEGGGGKCESRRLGRRTRTVNESSSAIVTRG